MSPYAVWPVVNSVGHREVLTLHLFKASVPMLARQQRLESLSEKCPGKTCGFEVAIVLLPWLRLLIILFLRPKHAASPAASFSPSLWFSFSFSALHNSQLPLLPPNCEAATATTPADSCSTDLGALNQAAAPDAYSQTFLHKMAEGGFRGPVMLIIPCHVVFLPRIFFFFYISEQHLLLWLHDLSPLRIRLQE